MRTPLGSQPFRIESVQPIKPSNSGGIKYIRMAKRKRATKEEMKQRLANDKEGVRSPYNYIPEPVRDLAAEEKQAFDDKVNASIIAEVVENAEPLSKPTLQEVERGVYATKPVADTDRREEDATRLKDIDIAIASLLLEHGTQTKEKARHRYVTLDVLKQYVDLYLTGYNPNADPLNEKELLHVVHRLLDDDHPATYTGVGVLIRLFFRV